MNKQLGFLIDTEKCIGCRTCEFACRNDKQQTDTCRRKVVPLMQEDGNVFSYLSIACNHCQNPACMSACPERCFKKNRNGIVILDATRCTGCRLCEKACPFHAITIMPETGKADKCDMCEKRQANGELPVCVSSCVVGAISIIDMYGPRGSHNQKAIHAYKMKSITNPSIRFKEKKEQSKCFWLQTDKE